MCPIDAMLCVLPCGARQALGRALGQYGCSAVWCSTLRHSVSYALYGVPCVFMRVFVGIHGVWC